MKEIFFTFYQLFFIFILFLFPFHFIKEKFRFLKIYNFFDLICLNIIIQFTLYLILSFFIPNISLLINLIGIFSLILFSVNFSKIKLLIKNNYLLLLLIIVFLILVLCNFFYIASYFRLQWDGVAHWFWKVQSFHQGENLGNFQNLPHPAYPHLGTFLWANFWNVSFVDYEYFGRFYYAYIYLAAVFSILYPIKSKYLIIIISLVSFLIFDGFLLGGYQEFLIFFFITFSARLFYLLKYHNYLINNFLFFFILTLNLLIWSKQEGILYACILSFVYLICFKTHLIKKITLLSFLLIFIALYFYLNIIIKNSGFFHEPVTNNFERLRDFNLFIDSFIYISLHLIKSLISRPIIILSLFFLCYYKFLRKESFFKLDFYTLFFIFNIFLIYGIFFHTRYALTSMVPQVLGRLLLQTSGFYLISFVFLFNYFSKNEK
jgi:hypothetical protein